MDDVILFESVAQDDEDRTSRLIQLGHNVNAENRSSETPLLKANFNNPKIVQILLEAGAKVDVVNRNQFYPLHLAVISGNLKSVELLLSAGANIDSYDDNHQTALHYAIELGKDEIAKMLLSKGAKVEHEKCPFSILSLATDVELINDLLTHGANVNFVNYRGSIPLHCLAWVRDKSTMQQIVDRTVNIDKKCEKGYTPFLVAVAKLNVDLCRLLLDRGANIDARTKDEKFRSLHLAMISASEGIDECKRFELLELLLSRGAKPNSKNSFGMTPIHYAAHHLEPNFLQLLIQYGADASVQDMKGDNALHIAALNYRTSTIDFLLDIGFDINVKTKSGMTALEIAAIANNSYVCEYLLDRGAEMHIKSGYGKILLERTAVNWPIKKLLLEHLAMRRMKGIQVDTANQKAMDRNWQLIEYFDRCIQELERMKETKVFDDVKLFTIFLGNRKQISGLAKNENLVRGTIGKLDSGDFPIFCTRLWNKFSIEVEKQFIISKVTRFLEDIFKNHDPSGITCTEVVKYLNNEELIMLASYEQ